MESSDEDITRPFVPVVPSKGYLAQVSIPSEIIYPVQKKQLLILDLNGTLCSRSVMEKTIFFTRPHSESFFNFIFTNFTVMVWSSARNDNVNRMINMFGSYKNNLAMIWHRSHFNLSQQEFHSNIETLKDLNKVWHTLPQFNATNTLVLDDTPVKLSAHPYNLVPISTFNHVHFLESTKKMDRALCKVANYLCLAMQQSNVANFIQSNPFDDAFDWGSCIDEINDRRMERYVTSLRRQTDFVYPPPITVPRGIPSDLLLIVGSTPPPPDEEEYFKLDNVVKPPPPPIREETRKSLSTIFKSIKERKREKKFFSDNNDLILLPAKKSRRSRKKKKLLDESQNINQPPAALPQMINQDEMPAALPEPNEEEEEEKKEEVIQYNINMEEMIDPFNGDEEEIVPNPLMQLPSFFKAFNPPSFRAFTLPSKKVPKPHVTAGDKKKRKSNVILPTKAKSSPKKSILHVKNHKWLQARKKLIAMKQEPN